MHAIFEPVYLIANSVWNVLYNVGIGGFNLAHFTIIIMICGIVVSVFVHTGKA